jgi:preprotein translocase subunit SecA
MSRATLLRWGGKPTADWSAPERATRPIGTLDRLLARLEARVALRFDCFERRQLARFARSVQALWPALQALSDDALRGRAATLRSALHREGITPALAAQAFALAGEASSRLLNKRPYPVQLMGGYGMLRGRLIEMATGEGKTLTALLPSLTLALAGIPVHVVTVNDYLARRDAAYVADVLRFFGISVGVVTHEEDDQAKRLAYLCDVTYCVNKDLVFDYLRDGLRPHDSDSDDSRTQRGLYFALVDEADGVLIDEARTPLVIAREKAIDQERTDAALALRLAQSLRPEHFRFEEGGRSCRLTHEGRFFLRSFNDSLDEQMAAAAGAWKISRAREERVEQALGALHCFRRGAHYVVADEKVQIVDEFTGRILPDRTWERGLHQMIELKEGLDITAPRETIAKQTYPGFFSRYLRIAGMTGTGTEVAGEMKARFGMRTVRIPTHRPRIRRFLGVRLFATSAQRWQAIAVRAAELAAQGRAVLIGTRSVAASEELGAMLAAMGKPHRILNALQDSQEAAIIALAGQPSQVTVATNMAGRGTDIDLHPLVRRLGGLHVILSEFHESPRIDRQLYGRAGRQGDAGSCEAMVSLEDELFVQFAAPVVRMLGWLSGNRHELASSFGTLLQVVSQARAERKNAGVRNASVERDVAMQGATAFSGVGT